MRLINVWTLELEEFFGRRIPRYFILSHRWGDNEVSYKEYIKHQKSINTESRKRKLGGSGYEKITCACEVARSFGTSTRYMWIDTCCIDKRSTAELSEAINSMYRWYNEAVAYFAYLSDLSHDDPVNIQLPLRSSSWFTRGWTLQELIAPREIVFYGMKWNVIGHIRSLCSTDDNDCVGRVAGELRSKSLIKEISQVTKIFPEALRGSYMLESNNDRGNLSIAQVMSWASRRSTTRLEDEAYCLLGLLNVHMPLIYGEGRNAFRRLQEEVIKRSRDQSILAWHDPMRSHIYRSRSLADTPRAFLGCADIGFDHRAALSGRPYTVTNFGIELLEVDIAECDAFTDGISIKLGPIEDSISDFKRLNLLTLNCKQILPSAGGSNSDVQREKLSNNVKIVLIGEPSEPDCLLFSRIPRHGLATGLQKFVLKRQRHQRIYLRA